MEAVVLWSCTGLFRVSGLGFRVELHRVDCLVFWGLGLRILGSLGGGRGGVARVM